MNIKKHTNRLLLTIFTIALVLASTPTKINAEIPAIRGVYELFAPDVIGIGQALMTKGWIENVYDFAPKDNAAKKVIEILWRKVTPNANLEIAGKDLIKNIESADVGKILMYLQEIKTKEDIKKRAQLKKTLSNGINTKTDLQKLLKNLEDLKLSQDFMPWTAEAILWAFYENKFSRSQTPEEKMKNLIFCLKELGKEIDKKVYTKEDYTNFEASIRSLPADKQIAKIINNYDLSTNFSIKMAEQAGTIFPKEVAQTSTLYNYKGKMIPKDPFSTCFESTILDTISILLYDPKEHTYNSEILPEEATKSELFEKVIKDVFKDEKGSFIDSTNINEKIQAWIQIIENNAGIKYNKTENVFGQEVNIDLNTSIENLIKILNELYSLGFTIDPDINKLKINIKDVIAKPTDANDFWTKLFEYVSKKLETEKRKVIFTCKLTNNPQITLSEDNVEIADSTGTINVRIEYIDPEYSKFNFDFNINIQKGHAYFECKIRKNLGLTIYSNDFKNLVSEKICTLEDTKLFPMFILLADWNTNTEISQKMAFDSNPQIKNLFLYCLNLKNFNMKYVLIQTIIKKGLLDDKYFSDLAINLVEKFPNDTLFISLIFDKLLKLKKENKIIIEITKKLSAKTPFPVLMMILQSSGEISKSMEDIAIDAIKNLKDFNESKLFKETLNFGENISVLKGQTLLYCAVENKNIADAILKYTNPKSFDMLFYYIKTDNDEEAIKLITDPKTEINGFGHAIPLYAAVYENKTNLVRLILNHKNEKGEQVSDANVRIPGILSLSALEIIILKTHSPFFFPKLSLPDIEILKLLLNHKNKNGEYDIDLNLDALRKFGVDLNNPILKEIMNLINTKKQEIENQKQEKEKLKQKTI